MKHFTGIGSLPYRNFPSHAILTRMLKEMPQKIIVRMPNWIGDLVMATAVLTDLRKAFPEAEITAMCRHPLEDLLKEDRDIDELFSFHKITNGFSRREARRDIIEKLRDGNYDLGLLLTNSFSSAWWFWQGHVKTRVGYAGNFRNLLLTYPMQKTKTREHQVLFYKKLLLPLGIKPSDAAPRLFLREEDKQKAKELLIQRGYQETCPLIGIQPSAAYGEAKCWPWERYQQAAERLLREDKNRYVVFLGDAASKQTIKKICQGLCERAIDLAGVTSLGELSSLIEECDLLLTNDSGPMHIASALGVPLVALFGSTDQKATGPYRGGVVIDKKVSCSPCLKRKCPIDFRCMTTISVEEVVEAVEKILRKER